MSALSLLAAARARVADALRAWAPVGRGAWCRRQRRRLRSSGGQVVWVRDVPVQWAEWGARRGYFAIRSMGGLSYLDAVAPRPA